MAEDGFTRHVRACNNARLPGERTPLWIGDGRVGWLAPAIAAALAEAASIRRRDDGLVLTDPGALPEIARRLAGRGLVRWRDEAFDVRADPQGPALARIDRGALPKFGIQAQGVHVNGLVTRPDGPYLWIARRAMNKALDPGKLDHIVAGGIPAGLDARETLIKEAAEEASIPPDLAARATPVGEIRYAMERDEGLRRDVLTCYDLELPAAFTPVAGDGEVEAFELWPLARAFETVRDTDAFKFNVNLVLIDLFIRRGLITGSAAAELRAGLAGGEGVG
ncbi:NUDIX hydrolase [Rhodopila sp.]|uniref:NUDIX hydrolase n=1 Tax=Rhodopila sp. TaxID=2480087 RepID=UPI002CA7C726|nr:NUDIX domain-containing protein [Rhodopila sp.]HVZ07065.1 NUDIX domain-containing protein [Rhodopila sp.]